MKRLPLLVGLLVAWVRAPAAMPQPAARLAIPAAPVLRPVPVRPLRLPDNSRFVLPQVQAATPAAMRINRLVVHALLQAMDAPAPTAIAAGPALRLAQKLCCMDGQTRQSRPAQGLSGFSYRVLHNDGRLLSFEFALEHTGAYSWTTTQHAVFDVRTGRQLRLFDVVAETPAHLRQQLRAAINRRLVNTLREVWEETKDSAEVRALAERFNWNLRTRRVAIGNAEEPALDDFAVTARGVTVFYQPWLPPGWWPYSPAPAYFFPFVWLRCAPRWKYLHR